MIPEPTYCHNVKFITLSFFFIALNQTPVRQWAQSHELQSLTVIFQTYRFFPLLLLYSSNHLIRLKNSLTTFYHCGVPVALPL